ncbi:S8 family serine peptidase [Amycolatopsis albispora]|uniref:Peptidase S8 n=1 Tax=Amycolatopsis albispora TaxID=1804986 RepID=A0A344L7T1_9PSEU|nr:S8 family serine peptidase [Amycolatopsis albispora]AXB44105.1 peptidase S8 [Amycolatopsis albispora]
MRWWSAVPAVLVASAVLVPGAAAQPSAPPPQNTCANPSGSYAGAVPWGQRVVDASRVWPLTDGSGQLVAVIGTGVDAANAQFGPDQVMPVRGIGAGATAPAPDCDGRGTVAAGIVAAKQHRSTTFAGVAPGAKVLPVRYLRPGGNAADGADPDALAAAIITAVEAKAGVILVAVPSPVDSPALTAAVNDARRRGSVVISAASAKEDGAVTYPTATPGVLAVGSLNEQMQPVQREAGRHLSLSAPGAELVSVSAGGQGKLAHRWPVTDPSMAAAYVAGAAALLRAYRPELTPDQVVTRLTLTANRPPGGTHDPRRGWGLVDAYSAVSADIPPDAVAPGGPPPPPVAGTIVPAAAPARPPVNEAAGVIAIAGVGVAALVGLVVATFRRGRTRAWRPGRRT